MLPPISAICVGRKVHKHVCRKALNMRSTLHGACVRDAKRRGGEKRGGGATHMTGKLRDPSWPIRYGSDETDKASVCRQTAVNDPPCHGGEARRHDN
jgi:hypothetical protein